MRGDPTSFLSGSFKLAAGASPTRHRGTTVTRIGDPQLTALLQEAQVLAHPWVIGELALGQLARRSEILALLSNLPQAKVATQAEVMTLVETQRLFVLGIGYVDAHLLAATLLTTDASLWTRDKRLAAAAADLGISHRTAG